MSESLGYSVYLTSFDQQREMLERSAGADAMVFLSLHISEEFSPDYCARAESVCLWLHEAGFRDHRGRVRKDRGPVWRAGFDPARQAAAGVGPAH